jgi:hypothetical protein
MQLHAAGNTAESLKPKANAASRCRQYSRKQMQLQDHIDAPVLQATRPCNTIYFRFLAPDKMFLTNMYIRHLVEK